MLSPSSDKASRGQPEALVSDHRFAGKTSSQWAAALLACQNADGGWPYHSGPSWTEPTALALLALRSLQSNLSEEERARQWLWSMQRDDGGFRPTPSVNESTWVTAPALLALLARPASETAKRSAVQWLLGQKPRTAGAAIDLLRRLIGAPSQPSAAGGASWFPGTAAWVIPTSWKAIALRSAVSRISDASLRGGLLQEVLAAQQYLWSRRLPDGGWNHGGTYALSEKVESYPETTAFVRLALHDFAPAQSGSSVETKRARSMSIETWAWSHLATECLRNSEVAAKEIDLSEPARRRLTERNAPGDLALIVLGLEADSPANLLTHDG